MGWLCLGRVVRLHVGSFRRWSPAIRPPGALHSVQPRQWCVLAPPSAARCYSTEPHPTDLQVVYRYGRPVLSLPLPSRQERCQFALRPMLTTVDHFLSDLRREDPGVTHAALLTADGERVSSTTSMDTVLNKDFQLLINDTTYNIHSPGRESHEHATSLDDLKASVHMLHCALHLPHHQTLAHTHLLGRRDALTQELAPLEEVRARLAKRAESQAMRVAWAGLAYLSFQGGFLAYLTWFVFAWDVMEPVTYFLTYGTSMGFLAYYTLTKQDLVFPDAKDRQFLHFFHRRAALERFDTHRYNQLREELATVESNLERLRNPVQLQLPVNHIQKI